MDGKSIIECCIGWGITDKDYYEMLSEKEELQKAHQFGEMHCAAWWHANYRKLAQNGNATALTLGMKNIEKVGWQDRPEPKEKEEEPIRAIEITILPPRKDET